MANFVSLLQLAAETKDRAPPSTTHGRFYCFDFFCIPPPAGIVWFSILTHFSANISTQVSNEDP